MNERNESMNCELHGLPTTGAQTCALCVKLPGECDFGACTRKAAVKLVQYRPGTREIAEYRPACKKCASFAKSLNYHDAPANIEKENQE